METVRTTTFFGDGWKDQVDLEARLLLAVAHYPSASAQDLRRLLREGVQVTWALHSLVQGGHIIRRKKRGPKGGRCLFRYWSARL